MCVSDGGKKAQSLSLICIRVCVCMYVCVGGGGGERGKCHRMRGENRKAPEGKARGKKIKWRKGIEGGERKELLCGRDARRGWREK